MSATSRELAFEALAHRAPPRIPWTLYVAAPLAAKLSARWGPREEWPVPRDDLIRIHKPRYARIYERVRRAGKVVGHHSCGDNMELLRDFVDIGLQVFHPLQPEAMDIRRAKREFGRDLTFRGGIGTQGRIVFGTPDEARAEVREAVKVLAEGGGYFLETAKPLPEETPVENAIAVIEEMVLRRAGG